MWLAVAVTFFSMTFVAQASLAAPSRDELEQRVRLLEQQQTELEKWYNSFYQLRKNRVSTFLNERLSLGGYFEASVSNLSGPDMKTQTSSNNEAVGINITAELTERIRFITQTLTVTGVPLRNLHNNPNLTPPNRQYAGFVFGSLVANGFLEYRSSEFFNIQTGVGYVPFGIAYQQREPVLFHKRSGPQMLVNDDGSGITIASPLWTGLHIFGRFPLEAEKIGYNLYSFTATTNASTMGIGGRLWWVANDYLKAGLSFQSGEKIQNSYFAKGVDVDLKYNNFGLLSEYGVNSGPGLDSETYYFEPYYKFLEDHWLVYVNVEYITLPQRVDTAAQIPDPIEKRFYGTGVNWLPLPTVRFRLGYLKHDYIKEADSINGQKRDFAQIEFSTAIAF